MPEDKINGGQIQFDLGLDPKSVADTKKQIREVAAEAAAVGDKTAKTGEKSAKTRERAAKSEEQAAKATERAAKATERAASAQQKTQKASKPAAAKPQKPKPIEQEVVYTIGAGKSGSDAIINTLEHASKGKPVKVILDVRTHPDTTGSRANKNTSADIRAAAGKAGIKYYGGEGSELARLLGGKGVDWEKKRKDPEFRKAISQLLGTIQKLDGSVAILCSETRVASKTVQTKRGPVETTALGPALLQPVDKVCHRMGLIASELLKASKAKNVPLVVEHVSSGVKDWPRGRMIIQTAPIPAGKTRSGQYNLGSGLSVPDVRNIEGGPTSGAVLRKVKNIAVSGSRKLVTRKHVEQALEAYTKKAYHFILGGANGVDQYALEYLEKMGEDYEVIVPFKAKDQAELSKYLAKHKEVRKRVTEMGLTRTGRGGPQYAARNKAMVDKADLLVALSAGTSGTEGAISLAEKKRIPMDITRLTGGQITRQRILPQHPVSPEDPYERYVSNPRYNSPIAGLTDRGRIRKFIEERIGYLGNEPTDYIDLPDERVRFDSANIAGTIRNIVEVSKPTKKRSKQSKEAAHRAITLTKKVKDLKKSVLSEISSPNNITDDAVKYTIGELDYILTNSMEGYRNSKLFQKEFGVVVDNFGKVIGKSTERGSLSTLVSPVDTTKSIVTAFQGAAAIHGHPDFSELEKGISPEGFALDTASFSLQDIRLAIMQGLSRASVVSSREGKDWSADISFPKEMYNQPPATRAGIADIVSEAIIAAEGSLRTGRLGGRRRSADIAHEAYKRVLPMFGITYGREGYVGKLPKTQEEEDRFAREEFEFGQKLDSMLAPDFGMDFSQSELRRMLQQLAAARQRGLYPDILGEAVMSHQSAEASWNRELPGRQGGAQRPLFGGNEGEQLRLFEIIGEEKDAIQLAWERVHEYLKQQEAIAQEIAAQEERNLIATKAAEQLARQHPAYAYSDRMKKSRARRKYISFKKRAQEAEEDLPFDGTQLKLFETPPTDMGPTNWRKLTIDQLLGYAADLPYYRRLRSPYPPRGETYWEPPETRWEPPGETFMDLNPRRRYTSFRKRGRSAPPPETYWEPRGETRWEPPGYLRQTIWEGPERTLERGRRGLATPYISVHKQQQIRDWLAAEDIRNWLAAEEQARPPRADQDYLTRMVESSGRARAAYESQLPSTRGYISFRRRRAGELGPIGTQGGDLLSRKRPEVRGFEGHMGGVPVAVWQAAGAATPAVQKAVAQVATQTRSVQELEAEYNRLIAAVEDVTTRETELKEEYAQLHERLEGLRAQDAYHELDMSDEAIRQAAAREKQLEKQLESIKTDRVRARQALESFDRALPSLISGRTDSISQAVRRADAVESRLVAKGLEYPVKLSQYISAPARGLVQPRKKGPSLDDVFAEMAFETGVPRPMKKGGGPNLAPEEPFMLDVLKRSHGVFQDLTSETRQYVAFINNGVGALKVMEGELKNIRELQEHATSSERQRLETVHSELSARKEAFAGRLGEAEYGGAMKLYSQVRGSIAKGLPPQRFFEIDRLAKQKFMETVTPEIMGLGLAPEETTRRLESVKNQLSGIAKVAGGNAFNMALRRVLYWGTSAYLIYGGARALRAVYDQIVKLDSALASLGAVLRDRDVDILSMEASAFRLGVQYGKTAEEVVQAMTEIAQTGVDTRQIEELTSLSLLGSVVAGITPKEAAQLQMVVQKEFGKSVGKGVTVPVGVAGEEEMEVSGYKQIGEGMQSVTIDAQLYTNALDSMNEVSRKSRVATKDLSDAIYVAGEATTKAGWQGEEAYQNLFAIVGTVAQATGKSGEEVSTALKSMYARISLPKTQTALQSVGIATMDAAGNMKDFRDIIQELSVIWPNLTNAQQVYVANAVAEKKRYPYFLALMDNYNDYLRILGISQNASGSATKENERIQNSFAMQLQAVKTALLQVVSSFRLVLGPIGTAMRYVASLATAFSSLAEGMEGIPGIMVRIAKTVGLGYLAYKGLLVVLEKTGMITDRKAYGLANVFGMVGGLRASRKQATYDTTVERLERKIEASDAALRTAERRKTEQIMLANKQAQEAGATIRSGEGRAAQERRLEQSKIYLGPSGKSRTLAELRAENRMQYQQWMGLEQQRIGLGGTPEETKRWEKEMAERQRAMAVFGRMKQKTAVSRFGLESMWMYPTSLGGEQPVPVGLKEKWAQMKQRYWARQGILTGGMEPPEGAQVTKAKLMNRKGELVDVELINQVDKAAKAGAWGRLSNVAKKTFKGIGNYAAAAMVGVQDLVSGLMMGVMQLASAHPVIAGLIAATAGVGMGIWKLFDKRAQNRAKDEAVQRARAKELTGPVIKIEKLEKLIKTQEELIAAYKKQGKDQDIIAAQTSLLESTQRDLDAATQQFKQQFPQYSLEYAKRKAERKVEGVKTIPGEKQQAALAQLSSAMRWAQQYPQVELNITQAKGIAGHEELDLRPLDEKGRRIPGAAGYFGWGKTGEYNVGVGGIGLQENKKLTTAISGMWDEAQDTASLFGTQAGEEFKKILFSGRMYNIVAQEYGQRFADIYFGDYRDQVSKADKETEYLTKSFDQLTSVMFKTEENVQKLTEAFSFMSSEGISSLTDIIGPKLTQEIVAGPATRKVFENSIAATKDSILTQAQLMLESGNKLAKLEGQFNDLQSQYIAINNSTLSNAEKKKKQQILANDWARDYYLNELDVAGFRDEWSKNLQTNIWKQKYGETAPTELPDNEAAVEWAKHAADVAQTQLVQVDKLTSDQIKTIYDNAEKWRKMSAELSHTKLIEAIPEEQRRLLTSNDKYLEAAIRAIPSAPPAIDIFGEITEKTTNQQNAFIQAAQTANQLREYENQQVQQLAYGLTSATFAAAGFTGTLGTLENAFFMLSLAKGTKYEGEAWQNIISTAGPTGENLVPEFNKEVAKHPPGWLQTDVGKAYLQQMLTATNMIESEANSQAAAANKGADATKKSFEAWKVIFDAHKTMLSHLKNMDRITAEQNVEMLRHIYTLAQDEDTKMQAAEDLYQAEKELNQKKIDDVTSWIDHEKNLDRMNDPTKLEYLKKMLEMAKTREQRWKLEEDIFSLEREIQENYVSKAEAWAQHQEAMDQLSKQGMIDIYRDMLQNMGSNVSEEVRWRIEEELHRLEKEAEKAGEDLERSIFKRAAGLATPLRISWKEYKNLMKEGGEEQSKGRTMMAEYQTYMAEQRKVGTTRPVAGIYQGMWQEDLYQPLTDEDALKAMDEYAARTLAKKEADEAAAQASTAAAQAEISLSAIKAAMYEKYRADVNTTSNTTSAAGETMKLTFEDVRLAGIKVQDTLNLVKATSQSIEEETRTYWAKIATNIVNAAKGTSDLTADIANAIEVMKKSGVFELFGTLGKITPAGAPGPSPTPGRGPSRSQGLIAAMVALQQLGDPYVWGAEGPDAFDCSGLVKYSWGKAGKALPRVTWDMEKAATMIPAAAGAMYKWLAGIPGAMLFNASGSHMGMSIGGGKSIEAPRPGDVVKITDASKWAWAAWPLKSGGQIMRDNFPALLHRKEVVVNAPIVDKIEKAATTPPLQYNDNSTLIVQGTGMSETQIKGVLNDWEKEKQGRVANELKRYRR